MPDLGKLLLDAPVVVQLAGCQTRPLAFYLKALGVLRLVSEQADPDARGWWNDGSFWLSSRFDAEGLLEFFCDHYVPTPMLDPWGGGSGFFEKDKTARAKGVDPLLASTSERFAPYQAAISAAQEELGDRTVKFEKGPGKSRLIGRCRQRWRGAALDWLDAAVVLNAAGDPSYPALLGTGGNDGRMSFTSNFMQRIVALFSVDSDGHDQGPPSPIARSALKAALFDAASCSTTDDSVGQFHPVAAGGPNGSSGFEGGPKSNPWDYVLMLEGAIVLGAGLSRRASSEEAPQAGAPFAFRSDPIGYGSAAEADSSARGEQWMPEWPAPSLLSEIRQLFREGRASLGKKSPRSGLEMARSVARRGVDRRLSGFERYGYMERNGQSNLAVPLGRMAVPGRPDPLQQLVDEVAPWIDRLGRAARDDRAPSAIKSAARRCASSLFACTQSGAGVRDDGLLKLLTSAADAEGALVRSPRFTATSKASLRPLGKEDGRPLSVRWIEAVREDSVEFRLALAISQLGAWRGNEGGAWPVRSHWIPLSSWGDRFASSDSELSCGPDLVGGAVDLEHDLLAILGRRRIAAINSGEAALPLRSRQVHLGLGLADLEAFLDRRVDDRRILQLARALMSIDARGETVSQEPSQNPRRTDLALFGALRLAFPLQAAADAVSRSFDVTKIEGSILPQLLSGQASRALECARRRLRASGHRVRFSVAVVTPSQARRMAAALALPLLPSALDELAERTVAQSSED